MKLKALVVDDSRVMRNMIIKTINGTELADFEFTEAEDGADAMSKFNPKATDIIFVDWNMPNMNGYDFACQVRSMKNTGHIAIVMITSERTMGKIEDALDNAGVDSYICKPFTVEDLQRKLEKLIEEMPDKNRKTSGFFGKLMGGGS